MDAMATFISRVQEASDKAEKILEYIEDHMWKDADNVTWADAGDAGRMLNYLKEIEEAFGL